MERELSVLGTEMKVSRPLNSVRIDSLADVLKYPVFSGENNVVVVMDLDGVLCHLGKRNTWEEKMKKLRALTDIYKRSDEVIHSSARIRLFSQKETEKTSDLINEEPGSVKDNLLGKVLNPLISLVSKNSVSPYPVFSASSKNNLLLLAEKANPSCRVSFGIGLKKNFGGNKEVLNLTAAGLNNGSEVVVIGSSVFDRRIAEQIVRNNAGCSDRVTFFDTDCVWY